MVEVDGINVNTNGINVVNPFALFALTDDDPNTDSSERYLMEKLYSRYVDEYDFVTIQPTHRNRKAFFLAIYFHVQNEVMNIGLNTFDGSHFYGSDGSLKGYILLNDYPNIYSGDLMGHEVMHKWAAHGLVDLGFGQCVQQPNGHWGTGGIGDGAFLALYSFAPDKLVDNGDGSFTIKNFFIDHEEYVPLELYLAGLLEPESVPDVVVPKNIDCLSYDVDTQFIDGERITDVTFEADSLEVFTFEDIRDHLGGLCEPSHADSQKSFKMATIVTSERELSAVEMRWFTASTRYFASENGSGYSSSFQQATKVAGSLDNSLGELKPEEPNLYDIYLPNIMNNRHGGANCNRFPCLLSPINDETINTIAPTFIYDMGEIEPPDNTSIWRTCVRLAFFGADDLQGCWAYSLFSTGQTYLEYEGNLPENITITWDVCLVANYANGEWQDKYCDSVPQTFVTPSSGTLPTPTVLLSPANNSILAKADIVLHWQNSTVGSTSIVTLNDIENSAFYSFVTSDNLIDMADHQYIFNQGEQFEWRVRVRNQYGWGDHTPYWTFTLADPSRFDSSTTLPCLLIPSYTRAVHYDCSSNLK